MARLLLAQARRQENFERERKGLPPVDEADAPAEGGAPSKAYMVGMLVALGMSRADAEKEYDAQAAAADGR